MKKVYLIMSNEKYKIGYTSRTTEKRIKELQVGSSSEMRVIQEYESIHAKQIETILHRLLRSNKIIGEWFDLDKEQVLDFKNRCAKIETGLKYTNFR